MAVSKYQDALPLHRQEAILNRYGVEIPRNTLALWMIKVGELIQPLINLLNDKLLEYSVLQCDETRLQVLDEQGKPATSESYMWVRVGGPPTQPIKLLHYAPSRAGSVACNLLEGYQGYLQTDDYAGYNAVAAREGITQLGCWAHARRKFVEAQKANAKGKTGKADMAVNLIGKLYGIERDIQDKSPEQKYTIRQAQSVPLLQKIRQWLEIPCTPRYRRGYWARRWPTWRATGTSSPSTQKTDALRSTTTERRLPSDPLSLDGKTGSSVQASKAQKRAPISIA